MAKKAKARKKAPADATLRNVRASNRRWRELSKQVAELRADVDTLKAKVGQ